MTKKVLVTLILLVAIPLVAMADDSKISPDLRADHSGSQKRVIVQYGPGTQINCSGLLGLVGCLTNDVVKLGGTILGQLPLINGLVVILDDSGIVNLSNEKNVVYISADRSLAPLDVNANQAINAPVAWQSNYNGSGIGVALIDSGVNNHPDFYTGLLPLSRVVYNKSFVAGTSSSWDQYGHGTHIAGLIAGDGLASTGYIFTQTFQGVAPGAKIVNLRVLDANGAATDSEVIAAINQAIAMKSTYNIRVMNLSLGRAVYESYKQDPLCRAVEQAWKSGIVVVVAAGNNGRYEATSGYGTITAPGNDPYVITVGAMRPMGTPNRSDDLIASYSSKGPTVIDHVAKPDLVAPGNLLISTETPGTTLYNTESNNQVPYSDYVFGSNSSPSAFYFTLSGTSMATGVVSGAVADLLQAQPGLTPDQVKARLMKTAYKTFPQYSTVYDASTGNSYTSQYDVFTVGAGYLDLSAALASKEVASGSAMSPTAVYDPASGNVSLSSDPSAVWGSSAAWSGPAVWGNSQFVSTNSVMWGANGTNGSSVMWGATGLWGSSVMWGASSDSGFSTVWSNSVMWGASGNWANSVMWGASADSGE